MKVPEPPRECEYKDMLSWEGRWEWIDGFHII